MTNAGGPLGFGFLGDRREPAPKTDVRDSVGRVVVQTAAEEARDQLEDLLTVLERIDGDLEDDQMSPTELRANSMKNLAGAALIAGRTERLLREALDFFRGESSP